jgi:pimeloyl-ACP methyl ester carboxylesterase
MQTLFLLHGALGAAEQLAPMKAMLSRHYRVHSFSFSGHGGQPFATEFSIEQFSDELIAAIEVLPEDEKPVSVFGYSMGGYVATCAALIRPGLFDKIITLATKWHWDEATAARECAMLNPATIEAKVPAFAQQLAQRHAPNNWKELLQKTSALLVEMGKHPPLDISKAGLPFVPALLLLGDGDKTVSVEETTAVFRQWQGASLCVLPGTPHPLEKVDMGFLSQLIQWFLQPGK